MNNQNDLVEAASSLQAFLVKVASRIESTFAAMLERPVKVAFGDPVHISMGDVASRFPDGPVGLSVGFAGEFGAWHFLIPRRIAAAAGDLAALGDGSAEFDEAAHPAALKEVWSQILAAIEPDIVLEVGDGFGIESVTVSLEPEEILAGAGGFPAIEWQIEIEGVTTGTVLLFTSQEFASRLSQTAPEAPAVEAAPAVQESAAPPAASSSTPPTPRSPAPKMVVKEADFADFGAPGGRPPAAGTPDISTLLDISLPISIELGRTRMLIRDVLDLGPGSVIELDKMTGEPVDLFVNDKKFARGEVVVVEENFGVRITELLRVDERLKALR
ncbi:MAG: flagellar motor switch protein FliN [Calditrichaeota bacterium]|nr:flagellar motor switch protein FliN [Calditrichota bacterium]